MAENIHIDLSEDIEKDLLNRYQGLCDELVQKLSAMKQELEELCSQTQFKPMLNVVNETINLFNNEIHEVANQVFENWIDSQGSFSAMSENSQAGEGALETARQIEQNIREIFEGFWSSYPMGEYVEIDTSRPKIKSENFDELKEVYTKFFQDVEVVNSETVAQISEQGDDDPAYNVIIPAVKAITEPIRNAFEQFCTKVDKAKEDSEELKQQQDANNNDASEVATNTSASAKDIAEALKMFDDI